MDKFLCFHFKFKDYKTYVASGAVVVLAGLFMIFYAIPYKIAEGFGTRNVVTPRTLPYFTALVMLLCGLYVVVDGFRRKGELKREKAQPELIDFSLLAALFTLLGLFFAGFIRTLGYPLCNVLVMLAVYYIYGGRRLWAGLATGVGFTAISYLFFAVYLKLSIPLGFGL